MNQYKYNRRLTLLCSAIAAMLIPALLIAAEGRAPKSGGSDANQETVEMFSAMEKGQIAVKLIPKDSTLCHVLIENKTDKPLTVKLPETFAGVPVLAQRAGGGGGARTGGGATVVAGEVKAWAGAWAAWRYGRRRDGYVQRRLLKKSVNSTCHRLPGTWQRRAQRHIPYEIKPLESVTNKPAVVELCRMLGRRPN